MTRDEWRFWYHMTPAQLIIGLTAQASPLRDHDPEGEMPVALSRLIAFGSCRDGDNNYVAEGVCYETLGSGLSLPVAIIAN